MSAALHVQPAEAACEPSRQIELTEEEVRILCELCVNYRRRLPVYLRSTWDTLQLVDGVIAKLS